MEQFWQVLKYAFLGLVQGFTEPIPVSSSGHVMIAEKLVGVEADGLGFAVLVNFASLLAIIIIFRHDLLKLIVGCWKGIVKRDNAYIDDVRFLLYLIIGTIPAGIAGVLFNDLISEQFTGLHVIGITLLLTGIALWLIRNLKGRKNDGALNWKDALIVGLAQMIALIPGISRSGATIVASLARGMKQDTALRFSFFLYIPVSLGSMLLEGPGMVADLKTGSLLIPYIVAFICSLVASYFAMRWFMNIMARGNLAVFSIYCFIAGTGVLIYHLLG